MNRAIYILTTVIFLNILPDIAASQQNRSASIPAGLNSRITLNLKDVTLRTALERISTEGNFFLNYNSDKLPLDRRVSVYARNSSAMNVLMKVLNDTGTGLVVTSSGQLAVVPSFRSTCSIHGIVRNSDSGELIQGANITVRGTERGASSSSDGKYEITNLSPGVYNLEFSFIGFETERIDKVVIGENQQITINSNLKPKAFSLEEIVVTPGYFSIMDREPVAVSSLTSESVRSFPQIGEDIFRAVNRLPGIGGDDFTSKFTVRGGGYDEVLVLLDGMELHDPFHLKDIDGFLSIVDVEGIRGIDMMTGAHPAEYGNRLSGVFNMNTVTPSPENSRTSVAISFMNARFLTQGTFADGNGKWLLIGRRGYLDLMVGWLHSEDEIRPVFYDLLSKLQYSFGPDHTVSMHLLTGDDNLRMRDVEDEVNFDTEYGNRYGWITWDANLLARLSARTMLYRSSIFKKAGAMIPEDTDNDFAGEAFDKRDFDYYGIKQDWKYNLSDNLMLKWGFDRKWHDEAHDFYFYQERYSRYIIGQTIVEYDTTLALGENSGKELGAYFSGRTRIGSSVVIETGLRFNQAEWTDEETIGPRMSLVFNPFSKTTFRMGWGKYYQTQRLDKHYFQDGENLYYPSERSEHRVIGIEHTMNNGINIRVEAYQKKLGSLRPRYQNFQGSSLNPFAELHDDRFRIHPESGDVRGIELYMNKSGAGKWNWWASYSFSESNLNLSDNTIPRYFDQPHTVYLDLNYRPSARWSFNVSWDFHSGWPFTESKTVIKRWYPDMHYDFEWEHGPLHARRVPAYHRMDVRASRFFDTTWGRLSTFIEIRNLYNRKNIREYMYEHMGYWSGSTQVGVTGEEYGLPILPSFGISWDFR